MTGRAGARRAAEGRCRPSVDPSPAGSWEDEPHREVVSDAVAEVDFLSSSMVTSPWKVVGQACKSKPPASLTDGGLPRRCKWVGLLESSQGGTEPPWSFLPSSFPELRCKSQSAGSHVVLWGSLETGSLGYMVVP